MKGLTKLGVRPNREVGLRWSRLGCAALVAAIMAVAAAPASASTDASLVKDIDPRADSRFSPYYLTGVGPTLYLIADDGVHGNDLWRSDGTPDGTRLVKDITPPGPGPNGAGPYPPDSLTDVGGTLFFVADDGAHGRELWKSDGTEAGTTLVKDINPGQYGGLRCPCPASLTDVDGTLLFGADDGVHGYELWKSDGTEEGTTLVKDINPGPGRSWSYEWRSQLNIDGTLYFSADDGTHGPELWRSDGTPEGTTLVRNINLGPDGEDSPSQGSAPAQLTRVGHTLFFSADDGGRAGVGHGRELWRSDGTAEGTVLVKDINPSTGTSYAFPWDLTSVGSRLFFLMSDGVHGWELWKSDGTASSTTLVKDDPDNDPCLGGNESCIEPYAVGPWNLTSVNGTLLFGARYELGPRALWKSDGTEAGTRLVKEIDFSGPPSRSAAIDSTLYLAARDAAHGVELWQSDGTTAGTNLFADINPGPDSSGISDIAAVNDTLFFAAFDDAHGWALWKAERHIDPPRRDDYKNTAQFCKAEREFLGEGSFRQKHGGGANAYGKCVSGK